MKIVRTQDIIATPDEIWATLADFGRIGQWGHGVDHAEVVTPGEVGVGTSRRVQAGRNAVLEEVTVWQPPSLLRYRFIGLPPFVGSATNTWSIEASGPTCSVTLTTHLEAAGPPPTKLAVRALGQAMGKVSNGLLSGLKSHVESTTSQKAATA